MNEQPWILGIRASHNGSACLLKGDEIVVAIRSRQSDGARAYGKAAFPASELKKFHEKTGVPMLLNTSFNRMGQPIIETPVDAIECLLNSGLDCCVFEDRIVFKA